MNSETPRQKYLRFLGLIYGLASEFDDNDLRKITELAATNGEHSILLILNGLSEISHRRPPQEVRASDFTENKQPVRPMRALSKILSSREVFSSNEALYELLAPFIEIQPRAKESRERYVSRILMQYASLDEPIRRKFHRVLDAHIARNGAPDFITRWSDAIREL
jgi:hypothetical protein